MSSLGYAPMLIPPGIARQSPTWDPTKCSVDITLTSLNTIGAADGTATGTPSCVLTTIGKSSGKWYMEMQPRTGVAGFAFSFGIANTSVTLNNYLGEDSSGWGYLSNNGKTFHNASPGNSYSTYTINDIIMVALDMDNGRVFFGKNGVWQGSSDPVVGTNPAYTGLSGTMYFAAGSATTSVAVFKGFFGPGFNYTIPAGYSMLI